MNRRCAECHKGNLQLPKSMSDELDMSFWRFSLDDPHLKFSRHILFNLSRPEHSLLVLAPLSKAAGGLGICTNKLTGAPVFSGAGDPDYQTLLGMPAAGQDYLGKIKRFDMPGYRPRMAWMREMKRYGILPADADLEKPIDYYAVEREYWKSFWIKN